MVRDAVRGYWALASGLTDVTRQRATSAARALVAQGEATAEQVSAITEDLVSTSVTNRTALVGIVRHEIERARTAMGMPTVAEVEALSRRVAALESALARLRPAPAAKAPAAKASATKAPATKAARKTPAAKTAAAKTEATKRAPTKSAATKTAAATSAPATRAPATKTPAKRATATKVADGAPDTGTA